MEALKQKNGAPVPVEKQVAILYAVTNNLLTDIEVKDIAGYEAGLYRYLDEDPDGIEAMRQIRETGKLEGEGEERLKTALDSYARKFLSTKE